MMRNYYLLQDDRINGNTAFFYEDNENYRDKTTNSPIHGKRRFMKFMNLKKDW